MVIYKYCPNGNFELSTPKAIVINLAKEDEEDFYSSSSLYPCDGSDIDEDDEDDVEGNFLPFCYSEIT